MSTRFQTILNLFALAVIIFIAVDFFYTIIRVQLSKIDTQKIIVPHLPDVKKHGKPALEYYRAVVERNLFGSGEEVTQEIEAEEIGELEPTSLKIALLGTVVGSEQNCFAIIEEKDKKKQGLYRVGDSIQSAIVKRILRGKVILRVKDRDKILTIEEAATSRAKREDLRPRPIKKGETITVRRADVERSLKNVHQLLSQARVRPHFSEGKADGLAITHIKAGSIFARLGLKNGDIVQGIDGRDIKSPEDVLEMYKKLTLGSEVAIEIKRNGEQKIINYSFR